MASGWLVLIVPLVLTILLVGFALYSRTPPASSRNRVVRATPRTRRRVAPWVLTALRPFYIYNHSRHAYILRGVGRHFGPVLQSNAEPPTRTGRFDREQEEPSEAETERVSAGS